MTLAFLTINVCLYIEKLRVFPESAKLYIFMDFFFLLLNAVWVTSLAVVVNIYYIYNKLGTNSFLSFINVHNCGSGLRRLSH